jgi:hypothetical protein
MPITYEHHQTLVNGRHGSPLDSRTIKAMSATGGTKRRYVMACEQARIGGRLLPAPDPDCGGTLCAYACRQ